MEILMMMKPKTFVLGLLAAASSLAALPVSAEEVQCRGRLGAVSLDNVFVPDGASCVLERTRLNGSLVVGRGASLQASGVSINGNVQAEGAAFVGVGAYSIVGGSIQIVQGGSATIAQTRISGDLQFESNVGPLEATANRLGGSLQAFKNLGGAAFNRNLMNGNMQCKENLPAPTGSGNRSPSKEDQCARL
jgi:hypothetical protein